MTDVRTIVARLAQERYALAQCVIVGGSALSAPDVAFDIDVLVLGSATHAGGKEMFRYDGVLIDVGYFTMDGLRQQLLRQHAAGMCNIADFLARAELVRGEAEAFDHLRELSENLFKTGPSPLPNRPVIAFQVATLADVVVRARSGDEALIGAVQVLRLIEGYHQRLLGRWCNPGKFLIRESVALGESGWLRELLASIREVGNAPGNARFHAAVQSWLHLHDLNAPMELRLQDS